MYTLQKYRRIFKNLLIESSKFWPIENESKQVFIESEQVYAYYKIVARTYMSMIIPAVISIQCHAYFGKDLLLTTFIPNKFYFNFDVMLWLQFYFLVTAGLLVFSFDVFYMAQCVKVIIQLKIIKYRILTLIDDENRDEEFSKCMQHQSFLLK